MKAMNTRHVSLLELLTVFMKIGMMSFGGALSGWMHREIVARRQWIGEEDFLSGLALGQIMPGANVANLSLYIGQRLRGGTGAVVALTGMLLPPMVIVVLLAILYQHIAGVHWVHRFVDGVAAAAIGLTIMVGIRASRRVERRFGPVALVIVVILTVGVLRWPMVPVVLCVTPVAVTLAWLQTRLRDA